MRTPWGIADSVEQLGQGILSVSTPSHGGIWVPAALLDRIDYRGREEAMKWSHGWGGQWFEEDCCWAWVAVAFPALFRAEDVATARELLGARGFEAPSVASGVS